MGLEAARPRFVVSAIVCFLLLGCEPDLGECDELAAESVVFLNRGEGDPANGLVMFEGQALVQTSCGNGGFCHAPAARKSARFGAPSGLDFDVGVPCIIDGQCEDEDIERLADNQLKVFRERHHIMRVIENGSMPPGAAGDEVVESAGTFVRIDVNFNYLGGVDDGEALPDLNSKDGRQIVRNWLACGAPVVERAGELDASRAREAGNPCGAGSVGECRLRAPVELTPPDPNWDSIYDVIIAPLCGTQCHGPGSLDSRDESQLDLSEQMLAYESMVNEEAKGDECAGGGIQIVPGDSAASLLVEKMAESNPSCGDEMPIGTGPLPDEIMDPIREWIDNGAPL